MFGYSRDDRRIVGALREDRGAFDDRTAGGVRAGQPSQERENHVVVRSSHLILSAKSRPAAFEPSFSHWSGAGVVGGVRRWLAPSPPMVRGEGPRGRFVSRGTQVPNGSTVVGELALRPGFSPQARIPPTTHSASRGARRGLLVLTAGPAACSTGVTPPARWPRPNLAKRAGVIALFLARGPSRGLGRHGDVTRTEHERAARRRGELARDQGSRKVFSAIDAQRRLNARSALGTRTKTLPVGPSDPRYAYLTRAYDYPPLVRLARDENGPRVTRTMTLRKWHRREDRGRRVPGRQVTCRHERRFERAD